ncbi:M20 family metallopeptidase [Halalkalibacter alkaliphilus]|uniref:Probable succinyl-diaminopimelate desuccinylase n=1 Tax=Halalkalibacter alkaliphilus TaxID=2917993 RepID=A0A9X2CMI8_9BACI|nr:M20 family metallopeptidase [Halalkalibacter alkaliphilus]MCL7745663.1 M20 family metallopeptidase [Halalkalibacter alkaliphilus]
MSGHSEAIQLTQKLVQIPTENPNGIELECSTFVETWLRKLNNVKVTTQVVEEGRVNVIAKYEGSSSNLPPLVIIAHMDTVPVEGTWSVDPFGGEIIDGKLYGRGACDMKSGLAAALMTIKEISEQNIQLSRDLYVIASIDEEGPYMKGAVALVDEQLIPDDALLIATEPTNATLATVHKGTIWYEVMVEGKSSHGGNAHLGADAAHAAAEIIVSIKEKVQKLPYHHEIFGAPAVSVGTIGGGNKTNMVAGSCRMELDFRLVPPMTKEEANQLVADAVQQGCAKVKGTKARTEHYGWERPPVETGDHSPLIDCFNKAYSNVTGTELQQSGFPAYTDVSMIGLKTGNRNLVVFGPGHLDQAHAIDEYVEVEQIDLCTKVLIETAKTLEVSALSKS